MGKGKKHKKKDWEFGDAASFVGDKGWGGERDFMATENWSVPADDLIGDKKLRRQLVEDAKLDNT